MLKSKDIRLKREPLYISRPDRGLLQHHLLSGLTFINDMIKKIRHSIALRMFRDKKFLKAIALVLLYHAKTNNNICRDFTINKLRAITGASATTIRERLKTLRERGLAKIEGGTLVFSSITSKHAERNQRVDNVAYDSLANVEKSLYATLICMLQSRKDFIHRAFLLAQNSHDVNIIKRAKCIIRKYAKGEKYTEFGLSYQKIAKKLGVSIKSAFDYVKFAIAKKLISCQNHFERKILKGVNHYPVPGYTFTTMNFAYLVKANTYTILNNKDEGKGALATASFGSRPLA